MNDVETKAELATEEVMDEPERVIVFEEALEAILFAAGHPVTYATLARVFEMTPQRIKDRVFEYALKYNDPTIPRGVILITYSDSCQLCTKNVTSPRVTGKLLLGGAKNVPSLTLILHPPLIDRYIVGRHRKTLHHPFATSTNSPTRSLSGEYTGLTVSLLQR
jgi:hypothetical protein